MAMFDVFYRANLDESYKYVVLRDNSYVLLNSPDTTVGYEFFPNISSGAYQLATITSDETSSLVETTNSFLGRPDFVNIAICCVIFLVCFIKLFNLSTVMIQRGGVFSDL